MVTGHLKQIVLGIAVFLISGVLVTAGEQKSGKGSATASGP